MSEEKMIPNNLKLTVELSMVPEGATSGYDHESGPWSEPGPTLFWAIAESAARTLTKEHRAIVDEMIRAEVEKVIGDTIRVTVRERVLALLEQGLPFGNGYGEPKRKSVEDIATEYLTKGQNDGYGRQTDTTIQAITKEIVAAQLKTTQGLFAKEIEEAKAAIREDFGKKVAETAAKALGVRF